jgi:phage terminase large subunit GpA-like protein
MPKVTISNKIKNHIRAAYRGCVCCGTWDAFDTGHVVSESRGGSLDIQNLRLMCDRCNGAIRNANFRMARYATPNDGQRAIVETNRAAWFSYCDAEIKFWKAQDNCEAGKIKANPYRRPPPYAAPI